MKKVTGINRYLSVGVNAQWIVDYMKNAAYEPGNRKSDVMFDFLTDAGIVSKKKFTDFGLFIQRHGLDDENMWALMLCNLAYTSEFGWYIRNIPLHEVYTKERLDVDLGSDITDKAKGEFWNAFKVILDSTEAFRNIGLGIPDITTKAIRSGERKTLNSLTRRPWAAPDPRVVLYSLYKYSEAVGGDCQGPRVAADTMQRGVSRGRGRGKSCFRRGVCIANTLALTKSTFHR